MTRQTKALLYGVWETSDGCELLFDRGYRPRWRRQDGTVTPADPAEWIENIVGQAWLYSERTPLAERRAIAAAVLRSWGVAA